MTKVSIFGQPDAEAKKLKPIELVKLLTSGCKLEDAEESADSWENIILLEEKYTSDGLDVIMAWDYIGNKTIYLGHWNDGVV